MHNDYALGVILLERFHLHILYMGVGTGVATGARAPPVFELAYMQFRMRSNPTSLHINSQTHKFYCHHIMPPPQPKTSSYTPAVSCDQ